MTEPTTEEPTVGKSMIQTLLQAGNCLLAAAGFYVSMTAYELSEILPTQAEEPNED